MTSGKKPILRTLAIVAGVLFAIGAPTAQALLHLGLSPAEFSARGDTTLEAASYAFAIWGPIYVGLLAYGLYQVLPESRETAAQRAVGWPSVVALFGCGFWIMAAAANLRWLSVLIIGASAAVMIFGLAHAAETPREGRVLARRITIWPLALLAGWLTVASVLNLVTVATAEGLIPRPATLAVGLAAILAATGIALWVSRVIGSAMYLAPVVWGLAGVYGAERFDNPFAAWAAAAAALVLVIDAGLILQKPHGERQMAGRLRGA